VSSRCLRQTGDGTAEQARRHRNAARPADVDHLVPRRFSITWDYRCPFARNAHEHVLTALAGGADWDVMFVPFSLAQVHVEEGQPDVWDAPESDSGLLALQLGVAVRDAQPEQFFAVHDALFAHRHDRAGSLRDEAILHGLLRDAGADTEAAFAEVASGRPLATVKGEHTAYATSHHVWGVPTFIVDDRAVFVRLMDRPEGDVARATATIERVLDLVEWTDLNEFKHTSIPR
jgi:Thioredoxin